jgi:putative transposase
MKPRPRLWAGALAHRVGTLKIGDPRGALAVRAGRRHNKRVRDWRIGHLIGCLTRLSRPGS